MRLTTMEVGMTSVLFLGVVAYSVVVAEAFNMEFKYLLAEYDDCYALLSTKDIQAGDFMADMKCIYLAPEIDGFIGFLKVVACTKPKGNLPLIDEKQIFCFDEFKEIEL